MSEIWTIRKILSWTTDYFKEKGIDSPRLTAELLLSKTLNKPRLYLYTNFNQPLNRDELLNFKNLIKKRVNGEPTYYIIGEKEFWTFKVKVNEHVLIPRPETEVLIEHVLIYAKKLKHNKVNILEIGTGSGNIAIALSKELSNNTAILSIDKSIEALKVAKENILMNNVENINIVNGDIATPLKMKRYFDIIVSNPPYIKTDDLDGLQREIKEYEPIVALNGGKEGMFFFEKIIHVASEILKKSGKIFFEFGEKEQGEKIEQLLKERGFENIEIYKDYADSPRVISGELFN